ncbi:MAG: hypothetical protein R2818_14485 [Flavobacteriales bacterium]
MDNEEDIFRDSESRGLTTFAEYYTPVALEIIDLVILLKKDLNEKASRGEADPELTDRLVELDRIAELVHTVAERRCTSEQAEEQEKGEEFMERLKADCPTCGTETDVHLLGEVTHAVAKVTNDQVRCTVCRAEFVNPIPITTAHKLKWMEYLLQELTTVRDEGDTWAERVPDQAAIARLMKDVAKVRKVQQEDAERRRVRELAQAKVDANLEATRNMLLLWHLGTTGVAGPGGGMA